MDLIARADALVEMTLETMEAMPEPEIDSVVMQVVQMLHNKQTPVLSRPEHIAFLGMLAGCGLCYLTLMRSVADQDEDGSDLFEWLESEHQG